MQPFQSNSTGPTQPALVFDFSNPYTTNKHVTLRRNFYHDTARVSQFKPAPQLVLTALHQTDKECGKARPNTAHNATARVSRLR